jgi:hypothetical protein
MKAILTTIVFSFFLMPFLAGCSGSAPEQKADPKPVEPKDKVVVPKGKLTPS